MDLNKELSKLIVVAPAGVDIPRQAEPEIDWEVLRGEASNLARAVTSLGLSVEDARGVIERMSQQQAEEINWWHGAGEHVASEFDGLDRLINPEMFK